MIFQVQYRVKGDTEWQTYLVTGIVNAKIKADKLRAQRFEVRICNDAGRPI